MSELTLQERQVLEIWNEAAENGVVVNALGILQDAKKLDRQAVNGLLDKGYAEWQQRPTYVRVLRNLDGTTTGLKPSEWSERYQADTSAA